MIVIFNNFKDLLKDRENVNVFYNFIHKLLTKKEHKKKSKKDIEIMIYHQLKQFKKLILNKKNLNILEKLFKWMVLYIYDLF